MRFRPRLDNTQREVVDRLRALGASVYSTAAMGNGLPDLIIGDCGDTDLAKCKSPRAMKKDGTQNARDKESRERQESWRERWKGRPPVTLLSADEAEAWLLQRRAVRASLTGGKP